MPVNGLKWAKETSQFSESFKESYNEESDERYLFEVDFQYPEKLHRVYDNLPFLPESMKINKVEKLLANLIKKYIET